MANFKKRVGIYSSILVWIELRFRHYDVFVYKANKEYQLHGYLINKLPRDECELTVTG